VGVLEKRDRGGGTYVCTAERRGNWDVKAPGRSTRRPKGHDSYVLGAVVGKTGVEEREKKRVERKR